MEKLKLRAVWLGPPLMKARRMTWRELGALFGHVNIQARAALTPSPRPSLWTSLCSINTCHSNEINSKFLHSTSNQHYAGCFTSPSIQFLAQRKRGSLGLCQAKKKGKKGGGKQSSKKKDDKGELQKVEPWKSVDVIMLLLLIVESYKRKVGKPLMEDCDISNIADDIWNAPFVMLAHDRFINDPVRFTYANKAGLALFEATWDEFVGMESAKSAGDEEAAQTERNDVLEEVEEQGVQHGINAKRLSVKGTKFEFLNLTLFNIESPAGKKMGQAAVCSEWIYEDGTRGGVGITAPQAVPSDEELAAAQGRVQEQAAMVRDLKENKGLTNQDDDVKAAVSILLESKDILADLEKRKAEAPASIFEMKITKEE